MDEVSSIDKTTKQQEKKEEPGEERKGEQRLE